LWQRVQSDMATAQRRPSLTTGGLAEIETLLQAREPLYAECARSIVDTVGLAVEEVAAAVLDKLRQTGCYS
jgi:shikimate kinase